MSFDFDFDFDVVFFQSPQGGTIGIHQLNFLFIFFWHVGKHDGIFLVATIQEVHQLMNPENVERS